MISTNSKLISQLQYFVQVRQIVALINRQVLGPRLIACSELIQFAFNQTRKRDGLGKKHSTRTLRPQLDNKVEIIGGSIKGDLRGSEVEKSSGLSPLIAPTNVSSSCTSIVLIESSGA
jgi:hypothetical protein